MLGRRHRQVLAVPQGSSRRSVVVLSLTAAAMTAFAANSVLCRLALRDTGIDAVSFTTLRLVSGALLLALLVRLRSRQSPGGDWGSALALFVYAAAFSLAYLWLPTGTGALLLFGAVQSTMIAAGWRDGERFGRLQLVGMALALSGLALLARPDGDAPSLFASGLMLLAGVAWGLYSVRGRSAGDPLATTAGNFMRAAPLALALSVVAWNDLRWDMEGAGYAVLSGAVTSAIGYAMWYAALPMLRTASAASVQLSVPVLAALAGVMLLGESADLRVWMAGAAILGGIALVIGSPSPADVTPVQKP